MMYDGSKQYNTDVSIGLFETQPYCS